MPSFRVLFAAVLSLTSLFAAEGTSNEPYRPLFHFSPRKNWTNDPNGLVYFQGEYHLFFQYNPFGDQWGHMSWGHTVSSDLLHWKQLDTAIPEENGIAIFTGSTVVDAHNTSGFCQGKHGCLVAAYTGYTPPADGKKALQTQNLAYSNDRGRTWTKYSGNPVLDLHMAEFRDPKVFWSTQSKQWIMGVSLPDDHKIALYGSADLKNWKPVSEFGPAGATGGQWECPELFELPVADTPGESRWVLKVGLNPGGLQGGSGEQYFVGRFDGKEFHNENPASATLWTDYGKDCYCALTFNNLPASHVPVMLGWMDNWQYAAKLPTSPWRGQMTLPRELSLRKTPDGIRLFQAPLAGLKALEGRSAEPASAGNITKNGTYRLRSSLAVGDTQDIGWKISAGEHFTRVGYDSSRNVVYVDRRQAGMADIKDFPARMEAPLKLTGPLTLDVVVDRLSVEVFANGGLVTITSLVFPDAGSTKVEMYAAGGKAGAVSAKVTELKRAD